MRSHETAFDADEYRRLLEMYEKMPVGKLLEARESFIADEYTPEARQALKHILATRKQELDAEKKEVDLDEQEIANSGPEVKAKQSKNSKTRFERPSIIPLLFSFKGRFGRGRFWLCHLASALASFMVLYPASLKRPGELTALQAGVVIIWSLLFCWMATAAGIKRYHDLGKSGWWILTYLIPGVNVFIVVFLGSIEGDGETNKYGPSPHRGPRG